MSYVLIATILLFLPGLATIYLLGLNKYRYLLSFALSYSIFVLLLKSMPILGLDVDGFKYTYFLAVFSLVLLASVKYCYQHYNKRNTENSNRPECYGCGGFTRLLPVYTILFVAVYFFFSGAYVELPADILQHLETIQESTTNILRSASQHTPLQKELGQNGRYWFYLYSFVALWSGSSVPASVLPASFLNVSIFLLGVLWFSHVVFRGMFHSINLLALASITAVFFTFFHFGINIFAFVRYYALAPAILNFVLYFSIMAIVIDFFRDKEWNVKYLLIAGIIFYASLYIHRQEALFAVLMVCIMSFYLFVQKHAPNIKMLWQGQAGSIQISPLKFVSDKINLTFLLTQAVMVSLFIYSYLSVARHRINEPKVIPLENIIPFFKNLYILNPTYQFYYVVTLWGAAVIVLFLLNIRKFNNNAFLMAGMLSPFFTVFNPFFTDLFLRHSDSLLLWRMSLLVPLQLVAAYLFVYAVQYVWQGQYLKKAYGALTIFVLISLLFPFKTTFVENTYSRMLTLKPVPVENSPEHWQDLIEYLNSFEDKKKIITDPVTGYMVTAITKHVSYRKKFHRKWGGYIKLNYEDYTGNPFDRYKGYLFIVNKRNGGMSETGRVARHWPVGILQIENYYYSENMEDYISSNPDRFQLLWEKDRVRVYQIDVPK